MAKLLSPRLALPAIGVIVLLGVLALSWRPDGKLHVHALNVDGMPVLVQTPSGRQILIGGSNSPSALLAALGQRMPFWDRDIDLLVVPRGDTRSLNGLLAVIDRYGVGHIVSVEIGDSRAGREWLGAIAAKSIEVIEAGSGVGIEEGVSLSLDASGWVRIDAGVTSAGIGTPGSASRVDVLVLDKVSDDARAWLQSVQPSIAVVPGPIDPPEGSLVVDAQENSFELVFDGVQWEVKAVP